VSAYREEPIALFATLPSLALDDALDALITRYGLSIDAIESQLSNLDSSVDFVHLQKLAAAAVASRAKSYL